MLAGLWRLSDCEELVGPQIEQLGRNAINYFLYDSWGQLAPPNPSVLLDLNQTGVQHFISTEGRDLIEC